MHRKKRTLVKDLFQGSGLTFVVVFVMEMVEEGLENLISLGISALFSTVLLVCFTQLAKIGIKKLIKWSFPFVKNLIYKENNDKMEKLKKLWSWVVANKCTLLGIGTGAVAAVTGAGVVNVETLPALVIGTVNITPILYGLILGALIIVASFFPETVEKFQARVAEKKAEKEQNAINKVAEKELVAEEKLASQTQAEKEKAEAKAKAEAEAKAEKEKAEKEYRAKIELAKADLKKRQAEKNNQA